MNPNLHRLFLARTGFDPSHTELLNVSKLTQEQLARTTVAAASTNNAYIDTPDWIRSPVTPLAARRNMSDTQRQTFRVAQNQDLQALRLWWFEQMVHTTTPLRERMVLFWHNHFASSQVKVNDAHAMWQQHQWLRTHALGSFKTMLHGIAKDPAMLIYLDGAQNRGQAPNENFAREVMELFTLGESGYQEADIKQAARAFTGYTIDPNTNAFTFDKRRHDPQAKTVLGNTLYTGEDVINTLLTQPRCAQFIVEKLWREFISPSPHAPTVLRLATAFRNSDYDIAQLLTGLFSEPSLADTNNEAALVKSPVELLVGTVRRFEIKVEDATPLALAAATMGQILFAPPSVKGWPTGIAWINANTLLARKQAIAHVFGITQTANNHNSNSAMQSMNDATPVMNGTNTLRQTGRNAQRNRLANNDLTGQAQDLPKRFRSPANPSEQDNKRTTARNPLGFDPQAWLKAQGIDPYNTVREPQRSAMVQAILHTAPALEPDSSLEGLPLLRALVADAAYQVK